MKANINKRLRITFVYVLIIALLTVQGCSAGDAGNKEATPSQSAHSPEVTESPKPTGSPEPTESPEPTYAPYRYETGKHCSSEMLKDIVGDEVLKAAYDVIDAFTAHKTSVKVDFKGNYGNFAEELGFALNCIYPPFMACAEYNSLHAYNAKEGTISWKYRFDKSECEKMQATCDEVTEKYMSNLREGDTDTAKALLLYNALTTDAVYDYDAMENPITDEADFERRTASYNALVNKSGICYSYSFALVYLYIHAGIDCITVSSQAGDGAHMWVMAKLAGKCYYLDPTWDLGGGFYNFGMTSQDRASWAGSYAEDTCYIHSVYVSDRYTIDDERFADMRGYLTKGGSYTVEIDREKQVAVISNETTTYSIDCH